MDLFTFAVHCLLLFACCKWELIAPCIAFGVLVYSFCKLPEYIDKVRDNENVRNVVINEVCEAVIARTRPLTAIDVGGVFSEMSENNLNKDVLTNISMTLKDEQNNKVHIKQNIDSEMIDLLMSAIFD